MVDGNVFRFLSLLRYVIRRSTPTREAGIQELAESLMEDHTPHLFQPGDHGVRGDQVCRSAQPLCIAAFRDTCRAFQA